MIIKESHLFQMAIRRRRTTTRSEPVHRRRTTRRKTTRRPNAYQMFVRHHWEHGQTWGANIRRIAGLWRQHRGTTKTHRIIHHRHIRRNLSF